MTDTHIDLSSLPEYTGVYLFKDDKQKVIYIGKAFNLKKRISSYFKDKNTDLKKKKLLINIASLQIIESLSEFEALILEAKLIKLYQPRYNILLKDDKQYLYLLITTEEYPRLLLSRKHYLPATLFGPFPSRKILVSIMRQLRYVFPFCTQNPSIKKSCFYSHLKLCNPCPAHIRMQSDSAMKIMKKQYQKNISCLKRIFSGYIKKVTDELTAEMTAQSLKGEYEAAAATRDKIRHLTQLTQARFTAEEYFADPNLTDKLRKKGQQDLELILYQIFNQKIKAETIECYDISNISGKNATGSLVTFQKGVPDKKRYRHFRIKTLNEPDDYAMLKEVFTRRLKHVEWKLPDLTVVDGGKQQLAVFIRIIDEFDLNLPVIALAKKEEKIIYQRKGKTEVLSLNRDSPALQLIQHLRDEAHRFAGRYHRLLRLKGLFNR